MKNSLFDLYTNYLLFYFLNYNLSKLKCSFYDKPLIYIFLVNFIESRYLFSSRRISFLICMYTMTRKSVKLLN